MGVQFEKGKSGNPGGRPKEDAEVKRLAREHTVEAINKLVEHMRSDNAKASVSACNAILDRGYGKPSQAVDHSGQVTHGWDRAILELLNGSSVDDDGDEAGAPSTVQ